MRYTRVVPVAFTVALLAVPILAGGGWVPERGHGYIQLGYSRKTADTSWDVRGNSFHNTGNFENHDFRYTYLSGEVGVGHRLAFQFLLTHLDGLEGPDGHLERNSGPSDAWLGLKYGLTSGRRPMALRLELRTPYLYDIDGPYERNLYDEDGSFLGHSPEWRGVLKHDLALTWLYSGNHQDGQGWWSVETGFRAREGAPANEIPINADAGIALPVLGSHLKLSACAVLALGNDSERQPDDRFGARATFNFNDASIARVGMAWLVPKGGWTFEVGYNHWVWGESARRYIEPYGSVSRSF